MSYLSESMRRRIVTWADRGYNTQEIAQGLGLDEPTVRKWVQRYDATGSVKSRARCPQAPYAPRVWWNRAGQRICTLSGWFTKQDAVEVTGIQMQSIAKLLGLMQDKGALVSRPDPNDARRRLYKAKCGPEGWLRVYLEGYERAADS